MSGLDYYDRDLVGRASNQIIDVMLGRDRGMGWFGGEVQPDHRRGNPLAYGAGSKLTPRMAKAKAVNRRKNKAAGKARKGGKR